MILKSVTKSVLIATVALTAVSFSPAFAAKRMSKPAGACATPTQRCISKCDQYNWCQVNTCNGGQTVEVPMWKCYQPSGMCSPPC